MCLAIPSRVVSTDGVTAIVDVCGARREASLMLLPEGVAPGDFVLVHAGFAMQTVDRETAEESLRFFGRCGNNCRPTNCACSPSRSRALAAAPSR